MELGAPGTSPALCRSCLWKVILKKPVGSRGTLELVVSPCAGQSLPTPWPWQW